MSRRTYEPEHRKVWQDPVRDICRIIDTHVAEHLRTGNSWHETQAEYLRVYLRNLKDHLSLTEPK
jgi:hypothetical protein